MFADDEIAELHAESIGRGGMREWFGADAYSFRRLGKLKDEDIRLLAKRLWMKRDRVKRPEVYKARESAWYRKTMATPAGRERLRAYARKVNRKRRKDPAYRARESVQSLARYAKRKDDPEFKRRKQAYDRARYLARTAGKKRRRSKLNPGGQP